MFAIASLLALGATGCGSSDSDTTVVARGNTTTTSDLAATAPDPATPKSTTDAIESDLTKEDFQLRPVLAVERCTDLEAREPTQGEDVLLMDDLPESDESNCYLVGPAGADGNDIATADAVLDSGQWLIEVTAAESSRGQLNTMFNACYEGASTCPGTVGPGAVAIVLDATVLSAPSVQAKDLADDSFIISGDFSEEAARELAQVLNG